MTLQNLKLLAIIIVSAILTNCNINESITINESGQGKYNAVLDMSPFLEYQSVFSDEDIAKEFENLKSLDSTFYIADVLAFYKDSLNKKNIEDIKALNAVKDFKVNIKIDAEESTMNYIVSNGFKDITQIDNALNSVFSVLQLSDNSTPNYVPKISYVFSKKAFISKVEPETNTIDKESKDMLGVFMGSSKYTIQYHFPYKIKKITLNNAIISSNKKSFTAEFTYEELLENPKLLDFEVKF